jgi:hypothetical protein
MYSYVYVCLMHVSFVKKEPAYSQTIPMKIQDILSQSSVQSHQNTR